MQGTKNLLLLETFFSLSLKEIVKGIALRTSFKEGRAHRSLSLSWSSAMQDIAMCTV